jgi:hypothetical protein
MRKFLSFFVFLSLIFNVSVFGANVSDLDVTPYDNVLSQYVDDIGNVNYKDLKDNLKDLDLFLKNLENFPRESYNALDTKNKIAFWINAYNAICLKITVNHYPISSHAYLSLIYPKNSIKQIPFVFKSYKFWVMRKLVSLNDINKILAKFKDPRIYFALCSSAKSSPALWNKSYNGWILNRDLDEQMIRFLFNENNFRIDQENNIIYLSSIFKDKGNSFIDRYGKNGEKYIQKHNTKELGIINFICNYVKLSDKDYLMNYFYKIKYVKFDWTLNE